MRQGMGLLVLLGLLPSLAAEERVIQMAEVSARAVPGYIEPTDMLRRGDKVNVVQVQPGFAAITPPAGAFSMLPHSAILRTSVTEGQVKVPYIDTLVGSNLSYFATRPGVRLQRGAKVHILDSVYMVQYGRPEPYYKIVPPQGELRYVPTAAFQPLRQESVSRLSGMEGREDSIVTASYTPPDAQTALLLREADEAYQRGIATGQWEEALQKYRLLADSTNHHARMTALNRLEFIRWAAANPRRPTPGQPSGPATGPVVRNHDWHPAGPKPPAMEQSGNPPASNGNVPSMQLPGNPTVQGGDRLPPTNTPPSTAFTPPNQQRLGAPDMSTPKQPDRPMFNPTGSQRPTMTTGNQRPITSPNPPLGQQPNPGLENHFPNPTTAGVQPQFGTLHEAYRHDVLDRPLYYLVNSQGMMVCMVTPVQGLDLRPYVGRVVEMSGGPVRFRPDLNNPHMVVQKVQLLAQTPAK